MRTLRFAFLGNHIPPHSTESHVARALETLGHEVLRLQEGEVAPHDVARGALDIEPDVFLWTQTQGLADSGGSAYERQVMLEQLAKADVPTVAYHLDRWWGLQREHRIHEEPFFRCALVCTADGGHDAEWEAAGVNHYWFPPGVSAAECEPGFYRPEYDNDVTFVGSWQGYGHTEWTHRAELIHWMQNEYHGRLGLWPVSGLPAVRGADLRDLYASTRVVVGDSCLVGGVRRYWSDRIPETLGRGGFLLHPRVDGMEDAYVDGEHLALWTLGDFDELRALIERYLADEGERRRIAGHGRAHALEHHTYEVRMRQLADLLERGGYLA